MQIAIIQVQYAMNNYVVKPALVFCYDFSDKSN